MKKVIAYLKDHPIIATLIYIFIAGWLVLLSALIFLDYWTHHGEESTVPTVTQLMYEDAASKLRSEGLDVELADSIYDTTRPAGMVVEQTPHPNAKVKPGRTVYLTIVAFAPKMVTVPHYLNVSSRQARAAFEGLGIKNVEVVEVESEYRDLVLGAKFNGVPLREGTRIPVSAYITLEVGKGYEAPADTIAEYDEGELSEEYIIE